VAKSNVSLLPEASNAHAVRKFAQNYYRRLTANQYAIPEWTTDWTQLLETFAQPISWEK